MMPRKSIPEGTRFGHLEVIGVAPLIGHRSASFVKCDCGTVKAVVNCALLNWGQKSCGCTTGGKTHGESKTRLYDVWSNMVERCTQNRERYKHYHGKGIRVCDEWRHDFTAFRDWALKNGYSDKLSIDRIDVNGNYEPSNCRWVTLRQQMNNRTTSVRITAFGETLTIAEWVRKTGINEGTLRTRLYRLHWTPEKALSTTTNKRKQLMKITALQLENVKRIRAVRLEPSPEGLTVIGGRNAQGKTSVLDGIAYALGGEKYAPSNLRREGAIADTVIHIETDDGLVIERKGKKASLTVTDREGKRHGQAILDAVIGKLAIDLPKFLNANDKQKAEILLQILGIGDELAKLEREEKAKYDTRTTVGRMAEQKKKAAADMPYHDDVPDEPVSVKELIAQQQEILGRNGVKQKLADDLEANKRHLATYKAQLKEITEAVKRLEANIAEAESADLEMEDTSELEAQIADFEETNRKISENAAKRQREEEADDLSDQYDTLTQEIDEIRAKRMKLLDGCDLPYPGLTVENGTLLLDGKAWDCCSGSQQMIVGCAIASRLNPKCKFVLLDKLEQLDLETLAEFDNWLKENDLQCIATRVSTGEECSLIIEDGEALGDKVTIPMPKKATKPITKELGDDDYE